jgi:DNA-binding CsgD family transcriptional regulator
MRAALSLCLLGTVICRQGDAEAAIPLFEDAAATLRRVGNVSDLTWTLGGLGEAAERLGDFERAAALNRESLEISWQLGEHWNMVFAIGDLALLAARDDDHLALAARLFGAVDALRNALGLSATAADRDRYDPPRERLRVALGDDAFAAAVKAGRAMPLEDAIAEAMAFRPAPSASMRRPAPHGLTPREVEVLRLVAQRWTDKEIAEALFLSPRTVTTHVTSILNKLGVVSRREAGTVAIRDGLV